MQKRLVRSVSPTDKKAIVLPKLGILAGGGTLPARLVEACQQTGRDFFVLAFKGQTDPDSLGAVPQAWIRLGEVARGFRLLHEAGVVDVVLAGPVRRPTLKELRPDWQTIRFFSRIGLKALGDDGLLRAVLREIESEGFHVVGLHTILPDILAGEGILGRFSPDEQASADIAHGLEILRATGALDIGQAIVIQQGIVLGIEAVEGTDALIRRCGDLRREGVGGVLVKTRKPKQEQRVDLPTIGPQTVRLAADAGLRGLAIEAGGTIIVDQDATVAAADAAGPFLIGVRETAQC